MSREANWVEAVAIHSINTILGRSMVVGTGNENFTHLFSTDTLKLHRDHLKMPERTSLVLYHQEKLTHFSFLKK